MSGGSLPPETDIGLMHAERRLSNLRFARSPLHKDFRIDVDDENQLIIPTIGKIEEELVDFIERTHPEGLPASRSSSGR
jgi:hypothetical protein